MSSSTVELTEKGKKKFVAKRRAPYLLQEQIIRDKTSEEEKSAIKKNSENCISNVDYYDEVAKLYGLQKKIAYYMVSCCRKKKSNITGPITLDSLCSATKTTKKTIKKILQRMGEKGLIARVGGKRGIGGFSVFYLPDEFINILQLQIGLELNSEISQNINDASGQESLSLILPPDWLQIDYDAIKHIGFGESQVRQIYNKGFFDIETVQQCINHFSYALKYNEKVKGYDNPLGAFISTLKRGEVWIESNYRTPQEIAQEKLLESKRQEKERLSKLEKNAYDLAFNEWVETLSEEQIENIAPDRRKKGDITPQPVKLRAFFSENHWDKVRGKYLIIDTVE